MARAIWSGSISFGLVTIPVELYSATEDHTVHFNQFQRGTSDRIRYKRVNERTGREVPYDKIVKGHEVDNGEYVIVEPEELDEIAPGRSRTLDIEAFVDIGEIDPVHFQKTYWLGPRKPEFSRPYLLLAQAMKKTNRAGIALFVMRGKQYLTALTEDKGVLAVHTLFFADEIRKPQDVLDVTPEGRAPRGKELDMAVSLVESMADDWRPKDYRDTYTERVNELIKAKQKGSKVKVEDEPAEATGVVDLMEALQRSVEASKKKRGKGKKVS
ncbi:DNA end-binding protein Ku [Lentzea albida]|uniref:Non-homologous end joining protein Ku n=1 Tax=Lentzea albida TaxID=65499 RepID=A0A1H9F256_9PSEU|nr:DNA end-binding protein Ku [Lentzea albida]